MGALDQLRDQEIEVGVSLAVPVGRHVDRHPAGRDGEIGAVVEVEAAQEILVRLAAAGVLGGDGAGHGLDKLSGAQFGSFLEVLPAGRPFVGRPGDADQVFSALGDIDAVEEPERVGDRVRRGCGPDSLAVHLRGFPVPAQMRVSRERTRIKAIAVIFFIYSSLSAAPIDSTGAAVISSSQKGIYVGGALASANLCRPAVRERTAFSFGWWWRVCSGVAASGVGEARS